MDWYSEIYGKIPHQLLMPNIHKLIVKWQFLHIVSRTNYMPPTNSRAMPYQIVLRTAAFNLQITVSAHIESKGGWWFPVLCRGHSLLLPNTFNWSSGMMPWTVRIWFRQKSVSHPHVSCSERVKWVNCPC